MYSTVGEHPALHKGWLNLGVNLIDWRNLIALVSFYTSRLQVDARAIVLCTKQPDSIPVRRPERGSGYQLLRNQDHMTSRRLRMLESIKNPIDLRIGEPSASQAGSTLLLVLCTVRIQGGGGYIKKYI